MIPGGSTRSHKRRCEDQRGIREQLPPLHGWLLEGQKVTDAPPW